MKKDKVNTSIKFANWTQATAFNKADNIFKWLYENSYEDKANLILGKRMFHSILGDMLDFVCESLKTIEKGKITISLALLRKPFRDSLLYLEWLLEDSEGLIKLAYNGDIDKYAIENISKENKISIIKNAIDKINNEMYGRYFSLFNENAYYDLRYNKDAGNSLQRVWDRALHLVTTKNHHRSTEFNFVFMDEEIHVDFVEHYYHQVPHLLFYTYSIVASLYEKFIRKISETTKMYNNGLIVYKLLDTVDSAKAAKYFNKEMEALLNFPCLKCKKVIQIDVSSEEFKGFRHEWGFECPECKNDIITSKYIFWEDYKEK